MARVLSLKASLQHLFLMKSSLWVATRLLERTLLCITGSHQLAFKTIRLPVERPHPEPVSSTLKMLALLVRPMPAMRPKPELILSPVFAPNGQS
jgi:hypothetical protein